MYFAFFFFLYYLLTPLCGRFSKCILPNLYKEIQNGNKSTSHFSKQHTGPQTHSTRHQWLFLVSVFSPPLFILFSSFSSPSSSVLQGHGDTGAMRVSVHHKIGVMNPSIEVVNYRDRGYEDNENQWQMWQRCVDCGG